MEIMKLTQKGKHKKSMPEYRGGLTLKLDELFQGRTIENIGYVNYIVDDRKLGKDNGLYWLAIRMPGHTVGSIGVDDNDVIVSCDIAERCIGDDKEYPTNVNEVLATYVGTKIETVDEYQSYSKYATFMDIEIRGKLLSDEDANELSVKIKEAHGNDNIVDGFVTQLGGNSHITLNIDIPNLDDFKIWFSTFITGIYGQDNVNTRYE